MSMTILLTRDLPEARRSQILALVPEAKLITKDDLASHPELIADVEISYPGLRAELWSGAKSLRWVQVTSAGVDWLLRNPQVREHPAILTNAHIHGACISEHLWGMCLMLVRNLHGALALAKERSWKSESLREGVTTIHGETLCVVGLGTIGLACARVGKAFGMRVIGIRRRHTAGLPEDGVSVVDEVVGPEDRLSAFSRARVIMAVLPGTEDTRHFIGKKELSVMKEALLFNAGRGTAIDTEALMEALASGKVAGAGLDVTDPEPLPSDHPLWAVPNVLITPHYAGDHPGYETESFTLFMENLGRYLRHETLKNTVDKKAGY